MTNLAILMDIHGNLMALEAIIRDLEAQMPEAELDGVVLCGDTISVGPYSKEVLALVLARDWALIRGNHEYYLLDHDTDRCPPDRKKDLPPFLAKTLNGYWRNQIAMLPDTLSLQFADAPAIRVYHSTKRSPFDTIYPHMNEHEIEIRFGGTVEQTILHGHNHLQYERQVAGWHLINAGSAGLPLDGIRKACYAILRSHPGGWEPEFRRVDFDLEPILEGFKAQKFQEATGHFGILIIEEFKQARTFIAPFSRWFDQTYGNRKPTLDEVKYFIDHDEIRWQYTYPPFLINLPDAYAHLKPV
ncbi:metallophosphoesterase family protein [Anaerolineales bacterium]